MLLTRLSFCGPHTISVGPVDFEFPRDDSAQETEQAIRSVNESASSWGFSGDLSRLPRAKTILEGVSQEEAIEIGRHRINEALDALKFTFYSFGRLTLMELGRFAAVDVGYVQNLQSKEYFSIKNPAVTDTPVFQLRDDDPSLMFFRRMLDKVEDEQTELEKQILRALKWKRRAELDGATIDALLFYWMARESLARATRDESDTEIRSRCLFILGFPDGRRWQALDCHMKGLLNAISNYSSLKKRIKDQLQIIDNIRNAIAHEGFKEIDLTEFSTSYLLEDHLSLLSRAVACIVWFASQAVATKCESRLEMWNREMEVMQTYGPLEEVAATSISTLFPKLRWV